MNEHTNDDADPIPADARKPTEYQRQEQERLKHQDDDPEAPGSRQSRHDIADESTR